jgi:hypothetical protein
MVPLLATYLIEALVITLSGRPPNRSTHRMVLAGQDTSSIAALMKMLVSTTSLVRDEVERPTFLIDDAVDIRVAPAFRDHLGMRNLSRLAIQSSGSIVTSLACPAPRRGAQARPPPGRRCFR